MNLPNKLTVLRVIMIPFFVFFYLTGNAVIADLIFIIASLTDMLDGKIARKYNLVTNFGKFMDPLADKLLVAAALICFIELGRMPAWIVLIIISREFIISGFRLVAAEGGKVIAAGKSGKFKTASTMIGLCVWMAFPQVEMVGTVVMWIIVITTIYSGVEYFIQNWNCLWD